MGLLLVMVGALAIPLCMRNEAFALSGTGIGIRVEGPSGTWIGAMIEYTIVVQNLGDYWIRNATVINRLPSGVNSSWSIPDLAPRGDQKDTFSIAGVEYTVQSGDVIPGDFPYISDRAEATGYIDVFDVVQLAHAVTDYPTFIVEVTVGGYSFNIIPADSSTPTNIFIVLPFIMTIGFSIYMHSTPRRRSLQTRRKKRSRS